MDLSVIKDQLADFGTFIENSIKLVANFGPAAVASWALLDDAIWDAGFDAVTDSLDTVFDAEGKLSSVVLSN